MARSGRAGADLDFARLRWVQAVDEAQELRTTRTDQPSQTKDLALAQHERGVVDVRGTGQPTDLQHGLFAEWSAVGE
jgi:hypothetical protein